MELKFALLADHTIEDKLGKISIIGEFNTVWGRSEPVVVRSLYLVSRFEAFSTEGSEHLLRLRVVDADGEDVLPPLPDQPLKFLPQGKGLPLRGQVVVHFAPLRLPKFGDYVIDLLVDGKSEGRISLYCRRRQRQGG